MRSCASRWPAMSPSTACPQGSRRNRDTWLASHAGEVAVEAHDVVVSVTRRRRQEADLRTYGSGEAQYVVVEQGVAGLHREAAAPEGDDLRRARGHGPGMMSAPPGRGHGPPSRVGASALDQVDDQTS